MALVSIRLEGLAQALKDIDGDAEAFLMKADRRIKVAGVRIEAYAKALAPVDFGHLHRSIRHDGAAPFLEAIVVAQTATNPDDDYAAVVEYGYSGTQTVSEHQRTISEAFGREITPVTVTVSAHGRKVSRKSRPYMRPAMRKALGELLNEIKAL